MERHLPHQQGDSERDHRLHLTLLFDEAAGIPRRRMRDNIAHRFD